MVRVSLPGGGLVIIAGRNRPEAWHVYRPPTTAAAPLARPSRHRLAHLLAPAARVREPLRRADDLRPGSTRDHDPFAGTRITRRPAGPVRDRPDRRTGPGS